MKAICTNSYYDICSCKKNYHLPLTLPIYDGHCHVDLFFKHGYTQDDFNLQLSRGRKIVLIDNRHQYERWFTNHEITSPNATILTTYGIHPKYIPNDSGPVMQQMVNIFKNQYTLNTKTVAIGECGLDNSSRYSLNSQLSIFQFQLKLAAELQIPIVLHGRGENVFSLMFDELKMYLKPNHYIHWHCVNPQSDLYVISMFMDYFQNSFIGLNGSVMLSHDQEQINTFNKWLFNKPNIIDRIVLETDYPHLRPPELNVSQYTPLSGISTTSKNVVNILRMKNMNITKLIDKSNNNIRRMYSID
ncbi:unnamed protein product [Adineta ricciae]|uniref:Uncharacterized protein n=1 Tax=Adineta ricciae TaxID=249248 RepID=A0A815WXC7_ADIRI|nr:unnamed protein product [Adineta ricciae]